MEETNHQGTSDDSEEEEIVSIRKVKRKTILDDDSDSDEEVGKSLSSNENGHDDTPKIEDDDEIKLTFDDIETENDKDVTLKESEGESEDNEDNQPSNLRIDFKDSDLFQAQSDDEDRPVLTDKEEDQNSSDEGNDGDGNDEGFDESQIDPKLLAKLKKMKGASKTEKQKEKLQRKAKPTAEQMSELYSESQRMARDTRVNLPYYEPEEKTLDDFLARASKKRQEYSVLTKPKDIQKALIIHEKLSITPPKLTKSEKDPRRSLKDKTAVSESLTSTDITPLVSNDSGLDSQELAMSQTNTVILEDENADIETLAETNVSKIVDDEELPDLHISDSTETGLQQVKFSQNCKEQPGSTLPKASSEDAEATVGDEEGKNCLQKDPSRDLFNSLTAEEQLQEESFQKLITGAEDHDLFVVSDSTEKNSLSLIAEDKDCDSDLSKNPLPSISITPSRESHDTEERDNVIDKENSPPNKTSKVTLLEKLQQQGLVVPDLPKLSGSPDSLINLDGEGNAKTPRESGLLKLMDRLVQHSTKKKPVSSHDVDLSIIEKEAGEGGQKELKLKSITYHIEEEKEEMPSTAPGAKLVVLKEKLGVSMKMKREEARKRRQQMFNLENEEGFAEKAESDIEEEEEEAEMTDEDSSSQEEEEDGFRGLMDEEDDGEDYNPLLDTEAIDDEEEEYDDYGMDENSEDVKLRFEVSDEEEDEDESDGNRGDFEDDEEEKSESTPVKGKKKSKLSIDSDDEEEQFKDVEKVSKTSLLGKSTLSDEESLQDTELTPLSKHFQYNSYHRDSSKSPELYGPSTFEESSNSTRPGDNLNDSGSCYNPHSQMLDADGYLKMTHTQRPPKSRLSLLVDAPEDNAIMDGFDSSCKLSAGKIFEGMSGNVGSQAGQMTELLGLCSGTFQQNSSSEDAINPSQNRREDDEEESNPFRIVDEEEIDLSNTVRRKRIKPVLSDSEDENENDTDVDEDPKNENETFTGFKDKIRKGLRREFVEDEAELSGSEYESDENLDLAEEDDILEEEAGDRDMAGVCEEELRNQVGKVHMKQLLDDDDRAVMRFKEMYLQDGDLYSDGNGRMRHFRWKEAGESSQQDLFEHHSDDEHVEEDPDEMKWRKERIEREKFLEESQQGEGEPDKELHKFGQIFMKRRESTTSLPKISPLPPKQSSSNDSKPPSIKKKGSFLSRGKDAFVKFAQIAKTALGGNSNQSSKSFVFQSKETQASEGGETEAMHQPLHPPKRKAHSAPTSSPQVSKKPRLLTTLPKSPSTVKRRGSIFNLLE